MKGVITKNGETMNVRDILIEFCDSIRDYERESGHAISVDKDDRKTFEFVDIFLKNINRQNKTIPVLEAINIIEERQ